MAKSLSYLGLVYQVEGDLVRGDEKLEESLRISEADGLHDSIAHCETWLGAHANWRGDFRRALALGGQGTQTAAEIHDGFIELLAKA
ncbi:MAG: hypothetical protein ACREJF_06590, partial [Candidatus Methylomirabilales bacterium]